VAASPLGVGRLPTTTNSCGRIASAVVNQPILSLFAYFSWTGLDLVVSLCDKFHWVVASVAGCRAGNDSRHRE
jgi:hypothetical protein